MRVSDGRGRLRAWTLMDELVLDLYGITRKHPADRPGDLPAALREVGVRAALRIVQGVHGEGDGGHVALRSALGALAELRYYLYLARRLGFIDLRQYKGACAQHERVQKCLRELLATEGPPAGVPGTSGGVPWTPPDPFAPLGMDASPDGSASEGGG